MSQRILVADDSTTIRKIVELAFRESGISVDTASTGDEAAQRFDERRPDLVLADVSLPEPNGYALCRRVKHSTHPVPVVLIAGAFEPVDRELARACGADDHVVKPFDSRALVERVQALLAAPAAPPGSPTPSEPPAPETIPVVAAGTGAAALAVEWVDRPSATMPALGPDDLALLARLVVERISVDVVREVAREVVPRVAAEIVRERIRELEREGA